MMRKPSEYIAAAARNIRDRLMDDCRMRLTHGDESAMVTCAASVTRGEDEVTDFGASEQVRVLSLASDFPTITKGSVATLGEHTRSHGLRGRVAVHRAFQFAHEICSDDFRQARIEIHQYAG